MKDQALKLVGHRSTEWSGKVKRVKGQAEETVADAKDTTAEATDTRRFAEGRDC